MESKASRTCVICRQTKPVQDFPTATRPGSLLEQANICSACRAASIDRPAEGDGDNGENSGGSGGLQNNAKRLQLSLEEEAKHQQELADLNRLKHEKELLGMFHRAENEQKKQLAQRELTDLKEDAAKLMQEIDEPNPDLSLDTQARREKITRLFSVTRSLARNYLTMNNNKAITQKNFGIFSQIKDQLAANKAAALNKDNNNKVLSKEASSLFSQSNSSKESSTNEAEQLAEVIRAGQKIFGR